MPSIIYEDVFTNKIQDLNIIIDKANVESDECNNIERRRLHSLVELLRLDIEDWFVTTESKVEEIALAALSSRNIRVTELHAKLDLLVKRLHLIPLKRSKHWWGIFDTIFRFISVCVCIITVGLFCSLPLMLLQLFDSILGIDPYYQIAEKMKRSIAWLLLLVSGISVDIVGASHRKHFESSCVLLTFSHASNLDGFLVSATCPVKHVALAKKELFVVPFFSWISLAFGGMPVDRNDRDRAIQALKRTTDAAKNNKVCIVVAPEGTRSTSGQLLPFKKGTFHMWEKLQAPIVPLIIYGAYDLYPVGSWVNNTGRVAVRYLPPILPTEAKDRDEMRRIVRRRMLEALMCCPDNIGNELTTEERISSIVSSFAVIIFNYFVFNKLNNVLFIDNNYSKSNVLSMFILVSLAITFLLYIYHVYIITSKDVTNKKSN